MYQTEFLIHDNQEYRARLDRNGAIVSLDVEIVLPSSARYWRRIPLSGPKAAAVAQATGRGTYLDNHTEGHS